MQLVEHLITAIEAVVRRCSSKQIIPKISQISQQTPVNGLQTLLKRDSKGICFQIFFKVGALNIHSKTFVLESLLNKVVGSYHPANTPRGFRVETTGKRSFPRRFNVESTWCCRAESGTQFYPVVIFLFFYLSKGLRRR